MFKPDRLKPKNMKFILSRTDDRKSHSKKWIVGYTLLFWLITRIIGMAAVMCCTAVYNYMGINPESLTSFGGSPDQAIKIGSLALSIITVIFIAPVLEEGIFRLGLSFRKWQVALSLALIPVAVLWQHFRVFSALQYVLCIGIAALVFAGIYFGTRQRMWSGLKDRYLVQASWIMSVAFGVMHLIAFSTVTWTLLPYCLCLTLIPFFGGCACTYLRVNLGFRWGLAMHIFNNLPALIVMATL